MGARAGVPGCRVLLSCAGAESRMRNPRITVSGVIRVQRAGTEPRWGDLGESLNAGSEEHV